MKFSGAHLSSPFTNSLNDVKNLNSACFFICASLGQCLLEAGEELVENTNSRAD